VYQADGTTTRIHPRLQATGAFRLLAFAGDIAHPDLLGRLQLLGSYLADPVSGLGHLTSGGSSALIEVLVIHCAERVKVELLSLHEVFRPWSETEGYDYWRVFADAESAHEGHGKVYERLEIQRNKGCSVVVRPDGYVGAVLDVVDFEGIRGYFGGLGLSIGRAGE
jgi:phenol 2-monooxygenase (NADPH)